MAIYNLIWPEMENFGSSVLLYSWCRIGLTWITSFLLSFWCVLISLFVVLIFQFGTKYFLIWCLHRTSFYIIYPILFGLLFLYLLVLNIFQLFFVYPFLFSVSTWFSLCFSLHDFFLSMFVKGFSNLGLPISLPLLPLFSFEKVNC